MTTDTIGRCLEAEFTLSFVKNDCGEVVFDDRSNKWSIYDALQQVLPSELPRQVLRSIQDDDLSTFEVLFAEHRQAIIDNCRHRQNVPTLLHTALLKNSVRIAGYLLQQEEIRGSITELDDRSGKPSRNAAACLCLLTISGNVQLFAEHVRRAKSLQTLLTKSKMFCRFDIKPEARSLWRLNCLQIAAVKGHHELLNAYLADCGGLGGLGKELDEAKRYKVTLLMLAARFGHAATVRELMKWAGKAGAAGYLNRHWHGHDLTALHFAAIYNHVEVVRVLEEDGNIDNEYWLDVMPLAAYWGNDKVVEIILKKMDRIVDEREKENAKSQALRSAAMGGHNSTIELIMNHKFSSDHTDNGAASPEDERDRLIANRPEENADELKRLPRLVDSVDETGNTALLAAVKSGRTDIVEQLLSLGADMDHVNSNGETVWHLAFRGQNESTISSLLKKFKEKRREGKKDTVRQCRLIASSPLHVAVSVGDIDRIRYVIKEGIDPLLLDSCKNTFLHTAAAENRYDVLSELVSEYEQATIMDNCAGDTPLHLAARKGNSEAVALLSPYSSSLVTRNKAGRTALHEAATTGKKLVVLPIVKCIEKTGQSWQQIDARDGEGFTALMLAAVEGKSVEVVQVLLDHGADLAVKEANARGRNVLHMIVEEAADRDWRCGNEMLNILKAIEEHCKHAGSSEKFNKLTMNAKAKYSGVDADLEDLTVIQLAAALGAYDILRTLVDSCAKTTCSAKNGMKEKTYYTEGIVPKSCYASGEDKQDESCFAIIMRNCDHYQTAKLLKIDQLRAIIKCVRWVRRWLYNALLIIHIIYMSFFSIFILRTCESDYASSDRNATVDQPGDPNPSAIGYTAVAFLVWPLLILVFEILNFTGVTAGTKWRAFVSKIKQKCSANFPCRLKFHRDPKLGKDRRNKKQAPFVRYVQWLENFSQFSSILFVCLAAVWFAGHATSNRRLYVNVSAVMLLYGWLYTMEYIKGITRLHAFSVMLKLVCIKDIFRIFLFYVCVLVAFALAVQTFLVAETSWNTQDEPLTSTLYQTFIAMLGQGDLYIFSAEGDQNHQVINATVLKLMFVTYVCVATLLLMNILIALMYTTFGRVEEIEEGIRQRQGLHFLVWIETENIFWMKKSLFRFVLKHTETTQEPVHVPVIPGKDESGERKEKEEMKPDSDAEKSLKQQIKQLRDDTNSRLDELHADNRQLRRLLMNVKLSDAKL